MDKTLFMRACREGGAAIERALREPCDLPHPVLAQQRDDARDAADVVRQVRVGAEAVPVARRTYVFASANGMETFRPIYERLMADEAWTVHTVECGHDVMLDRPVDLAEILLAELRRDGRIPPAAMLEPAQEPGQARFLAGHPARSGIVGRLPAHPCPVSMKWIFPCA